MKRIVKILSQNGPMLSGEIGEKLVADNGMSPVAARKAISRIGPPVRRLNSINFDNNQKIFYLEHQFTSEQYFAGVIERMKEQSKAYYAFIQALQFHNGFLAKNQVTAYTFSPIKPLKGHRAASRIIDDLCTTQFIMEYNDDIFQLNSNLRGLNYSRYRAIELAKKIIMSHFYDWARSINLIAYNSGKLFTDSPEFYKFQWGFTSPSYIGGMRRTKSGPTCFVVADILIGRQLSEETVYFFINKNKILRQQKKFHRLFQY